MKTLLFMNVENLQNDYATSNVHDTGNFRDAIIYFYFGCFGGFLID